MLSRQVGHYPANLNVILVPVFAPGIVRKHAVGAGNDRLKCGGHPRGLINEGSISLRTAGEPQPVVGFFRLRPGALVMGLHLLQVEIVDLVRIVVFV